MMRQVSVNPMKGWNCKLNRQSERNSFKRLLLIVVSICGWSFAAPVLSPVVALDGNPETPGVSPSPVSIIAGEKVVVAVIVDNARNVHSYSVKVNFDPHVVTFEGAVARMSPQCPGFLESGKGRIAAFLPIANNGSVEVAATLSGNDPSHCASGSGTLGYLYFTACGSGNPQLVISETRLVDGEGVSAYATVK